ncbi:hypothetical protein [Staphylococcus hyicus]|uniref:hypothetical protein n=1 Tax=Staphylococcus hyicus TaxID=1284 RepID=UPI003132CF91
MKTKNDLFEMLNNTLATSVINDLKFEVREDHVCFTLIDYHSIEYTQKRSIKELSFLNTYTEVKSQLHELAENIRESSNDEAIIPNEYYEVVTQLGAEVLNKTVSDNVSSAIKNDFWFMRLKDLLKEDVSKSRKGFFKVAAYWYVLLEFENYSEEQVTNELALDGFKMKEIIEKYNIDDFATFIEKVHYIASTKQIEYFMRLIKNSSANSEVKNELIQSLLNSNIIETW